MRTAKVKNKQKNLLKVFIIQKAVSGIKIRKLQKKQKIKKHLIKIKNVG